MKDISYERTLRCFVVVFSEGGLKDIGAQLISNMFDINIASAYKDLMETHQRKLERKGTLKEFEDNGI